MQMELRQQATVSQAQQQRTCQEYKADKLGLIISRIHMYTYLWKKAMCKIIFKYKAHICKEVFVDHKTKDIIAGLLRCI